MTDADSETLEDINKNTLMAGMTDDSCVLQLIEIVPLDRPSDDYSKPEFINPVVEVEPQDLQGVKHDPLDGCNKESLCCTVQVSKPLNNCAILQH